VRLLDPVSEDHVIAVFLRGELDSPRYGHELRTILARDGLAEDVLRRADLGDPAQNSCRRDLLDEHRAYDQRQGLFEGFPRAVDWYWAALGPDEVVDILYINWDWWLTFSGGTRRPRDAARRIRAGEVAGINAADLEHVAAALTVTPPPPELIAATTRAHARLVLVEGHARLTAYALHPQYLPPVLEILVGISDEMPTWSEF
jgi:hypothetical protein